MKPATELRTLREARDNELHAIAIEMRALKRKASPTRMVRAHLGAAMIGAGVLGLLIAPRTGRRAGRAGLGPILRVLAWMSRGGIVQRRHALNQLEKLTAAVRKGWMDSIIALVPGLFQALITGISRSRQQVPSVETSGGKECATNGRHSWGEEQADEMHS